MIDKPRLIEVAFPLKQASVASVHEKNVRHGHISTLHIWPARRPLAACRAALLCTLLPDPGDPVKRQALLDLIGGHVTKKTVKSEDDEGNKTSEEKDVVEDGVLAWGQENTPAMDDLRDQIRAFYGGRAPKILDPFAGGGAIPLEAMRLGCEVTSADLNPVAWFVQKCTLDYPQRFAGQKWPLPNFVRSWPDFIEDYLAGKVKKRRGDKKPHFTDPQQLQLLPLPDADLGWHVRAWGRWVLERAKQDLGRRYPVVNGEPTVAYLWARTARDPESAGKLPLLKTLWLNKKKGKRAALLPFPTEGQKTVGFALLQEADFEKPERIIERHQFLSRWDVTAETLIEFLDTGTMNRAGAWSPLSGRPGVIALTMDDLRRQGQQGLLGTQLTAVVVERHITKKRTAKAYRAATAAEIEAAEIEPSELEEVFASLPGGPLSEEMPKPGALGNRVGLYGFKTWQDMFTPRQAMALAVFAKHTREAVALVRESSPDIAEGVCSYLAVALDRLADRSSAICTWTINYDQIRNTFARFALPMAWDLAECVTTGEVSGGYPGQVDLVARYIDLALAKTGMQSSPNIVCQSALQTGVGAGDLDAVVTDPPYYAAIPYSDLMDFFYIWLRRTLSGLTPEMDSIFSQKLAPKWNSDQADGELVDDESRFGGNKAASKRAYEDGMAKAFQRACERLTNDGRLVIVFANKSVDAWETLVGALIRGGATVTASWPIQTEREARSRGQASAALSSSVWIVCRKRPISAPAGWQEPVIDRMKEILFSPRLELGARNILQYYFDLGIRGPDFIWAALGPALQAYSEHPFVKKTEGGIMTVREFLNEVRKLVLQFSLGELPGFREEQAITQGRGETITLDAVTQYYLLHRAYFGLEPAPAGPCILYANACGKNETELKVVWHILEQGGGTNTGKKGRPRKEATEGEDSEVEAGSGSGSEYRLLDWEQRAFREGLGEGRGGLPSPLIDKLHRLMGLFQSNQTTEVQQWYEAWGLASERAFPPLLQALRELAHQDGRENERRTVEALATQLRLNRRRVVTGEGLAVEEDVFPAIAPAMHQSANYRKKRS
jgi:adenine-specific DNA methylase